MRRFISSCIEFIAGILFGHTLCRVSVIAIFYGWSSAVLSEPLYSQMYERASWRHWIDQDGDCQNTRAEVLISNSIKPVVFGGYKKCVVIGGAWYDFYSGETLSNPTMIDIDHIVSLKFAHGHGGDKWSRSEKMSFANDLQNLAITSKSINRRKGDKSPGEWRLPNLKISCRYTKRFKAVVEMYGLQLIAAEKRALAHEIRKCPRQQY